jgi:hypothetical protein
LEDVRGYLLVGSPDGNWLFSAIFLNWLRKYAWAEVSDGAIMPNIDLAELARFGSGGGA